MQLPLFNKPYVGDCLALLSGLLLILAFAPFRIFPLAIISCALLLSLWLNSSPSRAFFRGWLFGLGLFGGGVYWIFTSIHIFGGLNIPLALIITSGLIAILALFPACNGYFLSRYFPGTHTTTLFCAFPAIWVGLEWMRSWLFSGFPWLFLGYSQINSPLKGYAPILSVYGVSLVAVLSGALLFNLILHVKRGHYKQLYSNLLALALVWASGSLLSFVSWTLPVGPLIKISLVQGNIPQSLKWSPEQIAPTLDRYQELTQAHWDSRMIVWPESAIPLALQNTGSFLDTLSANASKHHTALITGIPIEATLAGSYYNALITLGKGSGIYTKQRLVPFGEFTPTILKQWLNIFHVPMSDFIQGPYGFKPIEIDTLKIGAFICYEIAFPEQVRRQDNQIGMLLTISNDAWFGHSIAQAQHLEIGQMRALEMGRPTLFVSNDGITAFIGPDGKIQSAAPQFESYVLTDMLQAFIGSTPWQRWGIDPMLGLLLLLLFIATYCRNKRGLSSIEFVSDN